MNWRELSQTFIYKSTKTNQMKKNLFSVFMLVVVLFSCSSDDGDNNSSIQINPPQWIRGTWLID